MNTDPAELLSQYVAIDSSQPAANTLATTAWLQKILASHGIPATIRMADEHAGKANLWAKLEGAQPDLPPLLLHHHMDVVPAPAEGWKHPPFSGAMDEGYVWGRGALDDKGLGIIHLCAMLHLHHNQRPIQRTIILQACCDEEIGGELGAKWMRDHEKFSPFCVLDEGGGILQNGFGGRHLCAIEVSSRRATKIEIVSHGISGHGGMPPDYQQTAGYRLIKALNAVLHFEFPVVHNDILNRILSIMQSRDPAATQAFVQQMANKPRGSMASQTNASLTTISMGTGGLNVVPPTARAVLDCRIEPTSTPDAVVKMLQEQVKDEHVRITVLQDMGANPPSSLDHPAYRTMTSVIEQHFPDIVVIPHLGLGVTDARFMRQMHVPSYGLMPLVLTDDDIATIHSENERVGIKNMENAVSVMTHIIEKLANLTDGHQPS